MAPSDLIGSIIPPGVFIQQFANWRVAREQVDFQNGADCSNMSEKVRVADLERSERWRGPIGRLWCG